jgi:hypothetical protein
LAELGVKEGETKPEVSKPQAEAAKPVEGSGKNKKKKEKKKAKESEAKEEVKEESKAATELTPEERAAAVKAALNKRGAVQ